MVHHLALYITRPTPFAADTLDANCALLATMQRYKLLVPSPTRSTAAALTTSAPTVASSVKSTASSTTATTSSNNAQLLNELLGDLLIDGSNKAATTATTSLPNAAASGSNPLADLSDIFSSALAESEAKQQSQPFQNATTLLEPQVISQGTTTEALANGNGGSASKVPETIRKMPQIDMLSEELFQQILPTQDRMPSFKRDPEKITLNDLARERMHIKAPEEPTTANDPASDSAPAIATATATVDSIDDVPLLSDDVEKKDEAVVAPVTVVPPAKPLSEINVELDNIQATGEQRIVLDDDDMQLSLNFTSDRPGDRVSVIVISAQNKSRQPVRDFQFEASVKKVSESELEKITGHRGDRTNKLSFYSAALQGAPVDADGQPNAAAQALPPGHAHQPGDAPAKSDRQGRGRNMHCGLQAGRRSGSHQGIDCGQRH